MECDKEQPFSNAGSSPLKKETKGFYSLHFAHFHMTVNMSRVCIIFRYANMYTPKLMNIVLDSNTDPLEEI